ncbi:MAG: hypothetical protein IPN01_25555 [Deltaproteobacteria bacterium]|nr:hypothetical protein [Deltaproteobacteria bacterium]
MTKLQTLIARVNAGLAPLTARVDAVLESMSARDRKLAAGLFVFFLLLVVGGGAFLLKRDMESREKRLATAQGDLTFVRDEEATHRAHRAAQRHRGADAREPRSKLLRVC